MFILVIKILFVVTLSNIARNVAAQTSDSNCKFANYDFTPLKGTPWLVQLLNGTTRTSYKISICAALSSPIEAACKEQTAVCSYTNFGNAVAIGNHTAKLNITEDDQKGELWLQYNGAPCKDRPGTYMKTLINFKCGKTLGTPQYLDSYACDTYFEWHSSAACKTPTKAQKQVRCYVYDGSGKLHDLSPLSKQTGAYKVTNNIFINVCQDIIPSGETSTCAKGTAACQVTSGQTMNIGQPRDDLMITTDGKLYLQYNSEVKPPGCTANPVTAITFICPKRGGGRDPILTSAMNCHYDIEWQTEYACAVDYLTTSTCKFSNELHDIDLDLTPLRNDKDAKHPYIVDVTKPHGQRSYSYFLNVCGELGIPCPDVSHRDKVSACQLDMNDGDWGNSIGRVDHQTLRYVDGELTLIYRGGTACSSHFQRTTVINFSCNKSAESDGKGKPTFTKEDSCTYVFDWGTKYACLEHEIASECRVDVAGNRYDLSSLVRKPGGLNWEALLGFEQKGSSSSRYFVNICQDVLTQGDAKGCPKGAAACMRMPDGHGVNLGKFSTNPSYDNSTKTVKLHYTDGDICSNGKKRESIISLSCRPGDLESGPTLLRKSSDDCLYEFEWQTAAACVLSKKTGTDCKVYDDDAGYSFDLSRLTLKGDKAFYEVENNKTNHDYFINVCEPVTGTKCNQMKKDNAGVCQTDPANANVVHNTGKASRLLSYFDGMINLTYTDGDPYQLQTPIPRKTEIAFICDPSAGAGKPSFQEETDHTYSFRWPTMYACPEVPVECVITDKQNNKQYDLSSLSKSRTGGNWVSVDDSNRLQKRKFYINVCRPVNPVSVGSGCGAFAAVCQTDIVGDKEEMSVADFGKAKSRPVLDGEGQILLTYTEGAECQESDGHKKNYTTKLHLRCKKGDLSTGPRFWQQMGKCEVSFLWETEAACAIEHKETKTESEEGCMVKDPKSDYMFNLQPLMKKGTADTFYKVTATSISKTFQVNICGPVRSSSCSKIGDKEASVCDATQAQAQALGSVSDDLDMSDDGQLQLRYEGTRLSNGDRTDVLLTFTCNHAIPLGEPKFVRKDGTTFVFNFDTSLACLPAPVDCLVTDSLGNQYDLTPLAKEGTNWMAADTRLQHRDLKYFINVCRPLNRISGSSCPGGPTGGCQVDGSGHAHSMGYIQSKPYAAPDGSVSLRYQNGLLCHPGSKHQAHRSTRINFFCSPVEHGPVFQAETEECEYVFDWQTPSACPIQRVIGKGCSVTDPLYHYEFSMSNLRKAPGASTDFVVNSGAMTFSLNVCGALHKTSGACAGTTGTGACLEENGQAVSLGKANDNLIYEDGMISLRYTDGGDKNCTTIITFVCDHKIFGTAGPKFMNQTQGACTYTFEWATSLACTPFKIGECFTRDQSGNQYDLSKLTLTHDNYKYSTVLPPYRLFVINVCTTLVHTKGITCPLNAAACKIDLNEKDPKKKYISLGEVDDHPVRIENGHLLLVYEHGQKCPNGVNYTKTVVHLQCDKTALDSRPLHTFTSDNCVYHFLWMTKAACPIGDQTPVSGNCTVTNPLTGYKFSLLSLKSDSYPVTDGKGHTYSINVCAPAENSPCGGQSGSCQIENGGQQLAVSTGTANSQLHFNDGILYLNYSNGNPCPNNQDQTRSTIINFVCGAVGSGKGKPVFVGNTDDCVFYFSWHTELACEKQLPCAVQNKSQIIDLSPLIKSSGHHISIPAVGKNPDPGSSYYINVCRPLNPIQGTLCPPESSACRVHPGQAPKSVGKLRQPPFIDPDTKKVTLVYDHGMKCEKDPSRNAISRISFTCVPGPSQGSPVLEAITDECLYVFSWSTNVVCPNAGPVTKSNCQFYDSKTKYTYDFSSLASTGDVDYQVPTPAGKFLLNVCAGVKQSQTAVCQGAGVCQLNNLGQETQFGVASSVQFVREGDTIKMRYSEGTTCTSSKSGRAAANIIFECNRDVKGKGSPQLFVRNACDVVFTWKTPLACAPVTRECAFFSGGATYDLHLLSRETSSWNLTDSTGNQYWLNLCKGIQKGPSATDCPSYAAACRKSKDGQVQILGTVDSQEMYIGDDAKTVVVKYTKGSSTACQNGVPASTVIRFTCGRTVGGPLFLPKSNDQNSCNFEFQWTSSIACKEERETVQEKDGVINDARAGTTFNLQPLQATRNYEAHEYRGTDHYVYLMNINGALNLNPPVSESCKGAAICMTKPTDASFTAKPLGMTSTRTFYLQDDNLEALYTAETVCDTNPNKKTSILIDFHCSESALQNGPSFNYRTRNCEYIFDWYTSHACIQPSVSNPKPIAGVGGTTVDKAKNDGHSGGGATPGTVAGIVVLFVIVALIAVGLIYFHRPERRTHFRQSVRRIFSKGDSSSHRYSVISSLEEDDPLLDHIVADNEDELLEVESNNVTVQAETSATPSPATDGNKKERNHVTEEKSKRKKKENKKPKEKKEKKDKEESRQVQPEKEVIVKPYHDDSDEDLLF